MAGSHARRAWPVAVLLVCALAGTLFTAAHTTSRGEDLRPAGGDVAALVSDRAQRVEQRRTAAAGLQDEIDALSGAGSSTVVGEVLERIASLSAVAGLVESRGPGLTVTLRDAPRSADAPGIDPNRLVVHQQDIQAFINALWAGGAEAVSLQGQRLVSTSAILCVGSTVIIDGVAYAPPYVIDAVGDVSGMSYSLTTSAEVATFGTYAKAYGLGMDVERHEELVVDAYTGTVGLRYARALT